MDTKPKAYSYIRFSTLEQEKGDSPRRQAEDAEKYEEIEPGIIRHMASKSIHKIRIKFRGSKKLRAVFLNSAGEIIE
jgi:DNA invertase Pin-like site-specific DNA recombinase